jgi:hypothetical protein
MASTNIPFIVPDSLLVLSSTLIDPTTRLSHKSIVRAFTDHRSHILQSKSSATPTPNQKG